MHFPHAAAASSSLHTSMPLILQGNPGCRWSVCHSVTRGNPVHIATCNMNSFVRFEGSLRADSNLQSCCVVSGGWTGASMSAVQRYCTYLSNECLLQPANLEQTGVHMCSSALDQLGHGTVRDLVWDQQSHLVPGKRCLLYTSPSPRDRQKSRMPSSA